MTDIPQIDDDFQSSWWDHVSLVAHTEGEGSIPDFDDEGATVTGVVEIPGDDNFVGLSVLSPSGIKLWLQIDRRAFLGEE